MAETQTQKDPETQDPPPEDLKTEGTTPEEEANAALHRPPPVHPAGKPNMPVEKHTHVVMASLQAVRKNLNLHQRNSSYFSEAPRIGSTVLRRGVKLHLNDSQMKSLELQLIRLHKAHAIEIYRLGEKGELIDVRTEMEEAAKAVAADSAAVMDDGPKTPPGGTELPPGVTAANEPLLDPEKTQQVEVIPPVEAMKDGPDPTVFPVNPAAAATDEEVEAAADAVGESKPEDTGKKKSKRSKKE